VYVRYSSRTYLTSTTNGKLPQFTLNPGARRISAFIICNLKERILISFNQ
jgi:hypothetical protein